MDSFQADMNKGLQKLAADIIPSNELLDKSKDCADKIFKLIQQKSKFKVGHVCIAGSTGKKTTIMTSDVDLVLFINNELPLFEDVLDEWEDILTMAEISDVRKTKFSIQFNAWGLEFDMLPAVNFTVGIQADRNTLIDIQQQRVLAHIARDPRKYGYSFSSSLAEASIRFMARQSGFVHEMVRIAKFWYKTLHFNEYVSGAKSCIELIAVHAAIQEENMGLRSHLRCFDRFIKFLKYFEQLNIHFGNEHQSLDKRLPRVIDPVNPYNNLTNNWKPESIGLVKWYASETQRRLEFLANRRLIDLHLLFEPQPVYRCEMGEMFVYNPNKSQWLVSSTTANSLFPDLKIHNEHFGTDPKLRMNLEVLKMYLQIAICAAGATSDDVEKIKEAVQKTISKQVTNVEYKWCSSNERHENFDITFTIPVPNQKAIQVSYRL